MLVPPFPLYGQICLVLDRAPMSLTHLISGVKVGNGRDCDAMSSLEVVPVDEGGDHDEPSEAGQDLGSD